MPKLGVMFGQIADFVRVSAIGGFISAATLVVNLNFKAFSWVFGKKTKTFWWVFLAMTIIPLLVFIYIFSLLFGRL